jgi:hypothetical protein
VVRFRARTVNKKDTAAAHGLVAELEATQAVTIHLATNVILVRRGDAGSHLYRNHPYSAKHVDETSKTLLGLFETCLKRRYPSQLQKVARRAFSPELARPVYYVPDPHSRMVLVVALNSLGVSGQLPECPVSPNTKPPCSSYGIRRSPVFFVPQIHRLETPCKVQFPRVSS